MLRRVLQSGQLVRVLRERQSPDDAIADHLKRAGYEAPAGPKLLIWDNAPAHHPKRVLQAAKDVGVEIGFLPFRSPELNRMSRTCGEA